MIDWIKSWVKDISIFIILISLIEIIIPEKKYKGYIKVVLGMIFMLIVIEPIISLFRVNYDVEFNLNRYKATYDRDSVASQYNYSEKQQEIIINRYEKLLVEQIKALLEKQNLELIDYGIDFIDDNEEGNFGDLEALRLSVAKIDEKNTNKIKVSPINIDNIKVKINKIRGVKQEDNQDKETLEISNNVKQVLSNFYQIPEENIDISVQLSCRGD